MGDSDSWGGVRGGGGEGYRLCAGEGAQRPTRGDGICRIQRSVIMVHAAGEIYRALQCPKSKVED